MPPPTVAPPPSLALRVLGSMREVAEQDWDALLGPEAPPFVRWAFLDALERTGCVGPDPGWLPHHLALYADERLVGACPAYLKEHSEGEFVFDHAWAELASRLRVPYFPKLVVAVPFTPATGPRLLCRPEELPRLVPAAAAALGSVAEASAAGSVHVLFPGAEEAEAWERAGLALRYGLQFHWTNEGYATYEDFLARFSAKRRHQLRRERREVDRSGVRIRTLRDEALTPAIVDLAFDLYRRQVARFVWGRQYLTRAFFEELVSRQRRSVELVVAEDGGRVIAGALNLRGADTLYGRYWGVLEDRPFLHFAVCYYHSIEECIERGLSRFEPGAGGEHKVARGFEPTITRSAHLLANTRFDQLVRAFLVRERAAVVDHVEASRQGSAKAPPADGG